MLDSAPEQAQNAAVDIGAKMTAEFLACTLSGFLLFCVQANALLPSTKGSCTVGFPWIAYSAGLATFFPIMLFSHISADLNPAMAVAKLVLGQVGPLEFLVLTATQIAGWAVGALLMLAMYYQHFATVPKPGRAEGGDVISKSVGPMAMQIASVSNPENSGVQQAMVGPRDFMKSRNAYMDPEERKAGSLMERCEELAQEKEEDSLQPSDISQITMELPIPPTVLEDTAQEPLLSHHMQRQFSRIENGGSSMGTEMSDYKRIADKLEAEYDQAVYADQLVKLNIFVTTPAIPSFFFNTLQEFIGTSVLLAGALLIGERASAPGDTMGPFFTGLWVSLIILAFGGPTSPSVNPARDLGPRLVHWVVPIPGKGTSQWWYAPGICAANVAGGAAAAVIFRLVLSLAG